MVRLLSICIATLVASNATVAFACSVSDDYFHPSIAERARVATHIAIGVATGDHEVDKWTWRIRVERWLKGSAGSEVIVSGFIPSSACGANPPRRASILFLEKEKDQDTFRLSYIGPWTAVAEASRSNIAEVIEADELGVREYLRRKGERIKVRAIFASEIHGDLLAALEFPDGQISFAQSDHLYKYLPLRILDITEDKVRLHMLETLDYFLVDPIVLQLPVEMTNKMCISYVAAVNEKTSEIGITPLRRFLASLLSPVCRSNVEYTAWSNETIFRLMKDIPTLFFGTAIYLGPEMKAALDRELKQSIHGTIDYSGIYNSIKSNISDGYVRDLAIEFFEPFYKNHIEHY